MRISLSSKVFVERLGELIRKARQAKKITQEVLEKSAGLPKGVMSALEGATYHRLRIWQLLQICEVLEVNPEDLIRQAREMAASAKK